MRNGVYGSREREKSSLTSNERTSYAESLCVLEQNGSINQSNVILPFCRGNEMKRNDLIAFFGSLFVFARVSAQ